MRHLDGTLTFLAWVALYRAPRPQPAALLASSTSLTPYPPAPAHAGARLSGVAFPDLAGADCDALGPVVRWPVAPGGLPLCELDRALTQLRRPDKEALDCWLARYRGIGDLVQRRSR
ncbi:MAG: hypothetical protein U0787_18960 [Polyangia bacterium]